MSANVKHNLQFWKMIVKIFATVKQNLQVVLAFNLFGK